MFSDVKVYVPSLVSHRCVSYFFHILKCSGSIGTSCADAMQCHHCFVSAFWLNYICCLLHVVACMCFHIWCVLHHVFVWFLASLVVVVFALHRLYILVFWLLCIGFHGGGVLFYILDSSLHDTVVLWFLSPWYNSVTCQSIAEQASSLIISTH